MLFWYLLSVVFAFLASRVIVRQNRKEGIEMKRGSLIMALAPVLNLFTILVGIGYLLIIGWMRFGKYYYQFERWLYK